MGKNERRAYLEVVRDRYRQASKKSKAIILDEFCQVCGYNRPPRWAIRLLNRHREGLRKQPGRKPVYHSAELVTALKWIWIYHRPNVLKETVKARPQRAGGGHTALA